MSERPSIDKAEFIARFIAELVRIAGPEAADYLADAAAAYWDELDQREEGPEACAASEISCWED